MFDWLSLDLVNTMLLWAVLTKLDNIANVMNVRRR